MQCVESVESSEGTMADTVADNLLDSYDPPEFFNVSDRDQEFSLENSESNQEVAVSQNSCSPLFAPGKYIYQKNKDTIVFAAK
jgi:hypothetical protein